MIAPQTKSSNSPQRNFKRTSRARRLAKLVEAAKKSPELLQELVAIDELWQINPLQFFEPHSEAQWEWFEASTDIIAAFAGNQFGKTTCLAVQALVECVDREILPETLLQYKRYDAPVTGWIVCPTTDKFYDSLIPAFEKWTPKEQYLGSSWKMAWSKERRTLTFKNGSVIAFKTYEQDPSTLGGAQVHFVGYDEPPPRKHREECMTRLLRFGGYEMFAMTPLETNTGWVRRDIYRKREAPHITVIRGSMHDNPTLDQRRKQVILDSYQNDLWRRAREFGDFIDVGGLIYPDFERCVAKEPWSPDFIQSLDTVVSIDPGIRNAGIVWVGFDKDLSAYVFAEALLQDKTPADYAEAIRKGNQHWGLRNVSYVVDPAARARGQTNAETVLAALAKEGIYCNTGQNDVQAGIGQLRIRMEKGRFHVSPECRGLRDEADDYAAKEPDEGKDSSHMEPIKGNDHRLDALRYACMERFWDPMMEAQAPERQLGYVPNEAPDMAHLRKQSSAPPMGSLS